MGPIEFCSNVSAEIWDKVFHFFSPVCDNVMIIFLMLSCITAGLATLIRAKAFKRRYCMGIPEYIFLFSCADMVNHLPTIHYRIHLALSTAAQVIQSSETYTKNFEKAFNITVKSDLDIVSKLYLMSGAERKYPSPFQLYDHVYKTMDSIRSLWVIGDIHDPVVMRISTVIGILCFIFLVILLMHVRRIKFTPWIVLQMIMLFYIARDSIGVLLCGMFLWLAELEMIQIISPIQASQEGRSEKNY